MVNPKMLDHVKAYIKYTIFPVFILSIDILVPRNFEGKYKEKVKENKK